MQAIVFLPVILLLVFPLVKSWKDLRTLLLISVFVQTLILAPFILYGTADSWYLVMGSLVDQYQNVSLNAFNIWYLLIDGDGALYTKDYQVFGLGITYKTWGRVFFLLFGALSLFPLALKSIRLFIQKTTPEPAFRQMVFLCAFLCALVFFFFNTQMHERYSHPVMLMAFLYAVLSRNYWIYAISALAYFLNMEKVLQFFKISYHTFIFQNNVIAGLFLLTLIIGLWQLYRKHSVSKDWRFVYSALFHRKTRERRL